MRYTDEGCFTFDSQNQTITEYDEVCGGKVVIIPYVIGGVEVLHIGANAFYDKGIEYVQLPEDLLSIGEYAFSKNKMSSMFLNPKINVKETAFRGTPIACVFINDVSDIDCYANLFGNGVCFSKGTFWIV